MGGSSTIDITGGHPGVYGTLGTAAATNIPGSRNSAVPWTDRNGNLWLFGGKGNDSGTWNGFNLNDLWEFDPSIKEWTWLSGSSKVTDFWGQTGVYGTLGQSAVGNVPGGRYGAVGWPDSNGNLWLFGGWGCESSATPGFPNFCYYNDLWKFDPSSNQWTWMGGSDTDNQPGVYGTLGTPAKSNIPGGRENAVKWTDGKDNFWLFGGKGYDGNGTLCYLNDLWEYNPATGEWGWMSGSSTAPNPFQTGGCQNSGEPGVYGALGMPTSANAPGGRVNAVGWTDSNGDLWMFGGYGADSTGAVGFLNDLWKFNHSSNQWAWVGGSSTLRGLGGLPGIYNSWMTPAAPNSPGARQSATSWTDASGNFWLFGGLGYDSTGVYGYLNDLWEFNPSTDQWAWMGGSNIVSVLSSSCGVYGTLQSPDFMNTPGGRNAAAGWTDSKGNIWLFGGYSPQCWSGLGASLPLGYFNDLWEYHPNSGGQPTAATPSFSLAEGSYPAGQSLTISDSTPNAKIYYFVSGSAAAMQYTGPLIIASTETISALAVASGYSNSTVASANYTVPITAAPAFSVTPGTYATSQTVILSSATPGATIYYAIGAVPSSASNMYSGPLVVSSSETIEAIAIAPDYSPSVTSIGRYSIWPSSAVNQWAWMEGGNSFQNATAIYGTLGVPSTENIPGFHSFSATWTDGIGNLWLFGGLGADANGYYNNFMNDLWKFNPARLQGTWMGGSQAVGSILICKNGGCGQPGVYGTQGTLAAGNIPGGREGPASWKDAKGNFWLFGGYGYDSSGNCAFLNDMWEFNPTANEWAWMGGPSEVTGVGYCGGEPGVYGTLGTPSAANIPGGREKASTWIDSEGNFWLFGGYAIDATNKIEFDFNDLWKFSPSTNQWTWMGGKNTLNGSSCRFDPNMWMSMCGWAGNYGTLGSPSPTNLPGSRSAATNWTDQNGNLWLAGGTAFDAYGNYSPLNDVWKFSPSTNQWSWMGGSNMTPLCIANFGGSYEGGPLSGVFGSAGAQGVPAAGNIPAFYLAAGSWTDNNGNFWLFPGGSNTFAPGNALWEFSPSANEWAWMSGSSPGYNVVGTYGSFGTPAVGNTPGSRAGAQSWIDDRGNLWLFSGNGWNDLWEYKPSAPAPVPSFGVIAVPIPNTNSGDLTVQAGTSGTMTIKVIVAGGFDSPVALSASNLPTGVTASFSPASITGAGSSQMTVSVDLTVPFALYYAINVLGTSGSTTEIDTARLKFTPAPPPNFTFSVSPASLTMKSGGQGTAILTVTPQYGFNGAVNLSCSGLPAGATCSFNPTTVTPTGGAITSQVTITTNAQSSALLPNQFSLLPVTALTLTLCLLGRRQRRLRLVLVAMVFAELVLVSACGGGGGGGSSAPPPRTSTITITATAASAMHTVTLSLTVN